MNNAADALGISQGRAIELLLLSLPLDVDSVPFVIDREQIHFSTGQSLQQTMPLTSVRIWRKEYPTHRTNVISFNNKLRLNSPMALAREENRGRPSKGDRDAFMIKPARPLGDAIRANAVELGITYGDYVVSILARELGMPEHAPVPSLLKDKELPIKKAP